MVEYNDDYGGDGIDAHEAMAEVRTGRRRRRRHGLTDSQKRVKAALTAWAAEKRVSGNLAEIERRAVSAEPDTDADSAAALPAFVDRIQVRGMSEE